MTFKLLRTWTSNAAEQKFQTITTPGFRGINKRDVALTLLNFSVSTKRVMLNYIIKLLLVRKNNERNGIVFKVKLSNSTHQKKKKSSRNFFNTKALLLCTNIINGKWKQMSAHPWLCLTQWDCFKQLNGAWPIITVNNAVDGAAVWSPPNPKLCREMLKRSTWEFKEYNRAAKFGK